MGCGIRELSEPFTIMSDHLNLKFFLINKRLTERKIRFVEIMSICRYNVQHRKGKDKKYLKTLSRKDQDKPKEGDPRLMCRERQLLKPVNIKNLLVRNIELA